MRKDVQKEIKEQRKRKIVYWSGISLSIVLLIVAIALVVFVGFNIEENNNIPDFVGISEGTKGVTEAKQASSGIGKSIDEAKQEETEKDEKETIVVPKAQETAKNAGVSQPEEIKEEKSKQEEVKKEVKQEETKKEEKEEEPVFSMPVDGEVIREYAKDKLVYSDTLKEWVTHNGIDIKAEKTSVVKSSEAGTIKSIKNDPRYGLTVVIEHSMGYSTVYSNLLTAEFVVVGEKVEKGQTIGTVGNTATFEIADEPHLHFEILKDNVQIDPGMYIK